MQVSARILGQDYGLTAQEMNRVLAKLGFLTGSPGDYSPTAKALQYAVEKDFHRGTGGYACYNRYWTTRTFDDSIKDVLDVTPELIREVRSELTAERAARYALQAAERAKANQAFLDKVAAEKAAKEAAAKAAEEAAKHIEDLKKAGKIGLVLAGVVGTGYGLYKGVPKVKKWWKDRKKAKDSGEETKE